MKFFPIIFIPYLFAVSNPSFFSSTTIDLEKIIDQSKAEKVYLSKMHTLSGSAIAALADKKNLVVDDFTINDYFRDSVSFWFSIYTQYSSKQVLIHDKQNLAIIYRVLDFSDLHKSELNIFTKYKIQNQYAQENVHLIKDSLVKLSKGKKTKETEQILEILETNNVPIPTNRKKKSLFFKELAAHLRTQTGQKNMIYKGLINSEIYRDYLEKIMEKFNIPSDLLAIAFLESSFNYKATSKVGASGIWQFMPYISDLFMPKITSTVDYRSNPVISSIAAFHLLKQNKKILKRWDLAVPAYNSGTKHLVNARRKFKKVKNLDLAYILGNYEHAHLGFASQNFYSEYLALVHTMKYKNSFFNIAGKIQSAQFNSDNINVYVARCRFKPIYLNKKYNSKIVDLNPQFEKAKSIYPSKSLVVSDKDLPNKYFYKLKVNSLVAKYPKDWTRGVKTKNCKLL